MSRAGRVGAIIVAAGDGTRLPGPVPKPLLPLDGQTIIDRTLEAFERCAHIDDVALVVRAVDVTGLRARLSGKVVAVVAGGETRRASVAAGLDALPDIEWVVVHDGVRPLVSPSLIAAVVDAARTVGAATAALPVADTLKVAEQDLVLRTVDRAGLYAVQTPQAFQADLLRQAHRRVPAAEAVTDDAVLVERLGARVAIVPGDPTNLKITTPADLEMARRLAGTPAVVRIGIGYDVHRLVPDRPLVLGGVRIPHGRGLAGHSDADVLTHAIMDALLGAVGERDIGHQFPTRDPAYDDADSLELMRSVVARLTREGWSVVNVDAVVLAEAPRLSSFVDAMRERLAGALAASASQVGVKATTAEGLGPIGRGDAIAAQAVAMLRKRG